MTALTVDTAKNIGIAVGVGLVALLLVMALVIKNVTTKLIAVAIIGALAFYVWTQRSSLQDCADNVKAQLALGDDCKFLGFHVKVSVPGAP